MDTTHPSRTRWRKPARSGSNGNCDSHDLHGPRLAFTSAQWRAFTAAIRARQR